MSTPSISENSIHCRTSLTHWIFFVLILFWLCQQTAMSSPLNSLPDNQHKVVSAVRIASTDIYLFNSKHTRDYYTSVGGNYDLILKPWRDYFQSQNISYVDLQEDDLKPGLKPGVLILPSVVSLGLQEINAIQAFELAGGSVLATWATGARNNDAKWQGYDFLHDQFGIQITGEITRKNNNTDNFLVIFGETPVAHSLPAGSRIWFDQVNTLPLQVTGGNNVAGRFMDVLHAPSAAANEAIVYTEAGASRRAFFAFTETLWQFQQDDIYTLLGDTLSWLQRRPAAYLANWPYPYRSAQIIEMDTETGFPNAVRLSNMLEANGYQGTFYCLTSIASQYPDVMTILERNNEIAYHGDVHDSFKDQSRELQSNRMDAMQKSMKPLLATPSRATGFRPPYESYDKTTESLLFEKGFSHLLINSYGSRTMLPYLSSASPKDFRKGLIVLPRTQRGDLDFVIRGASTQDIARAMTEDFDQILEMGALGVLSLHSENFEANSDLAKSMPIFLAHVKRAGNSVWVAPSGRIESWWRERALIKYKLSTDSQNLHLTVTIAKPGLSQNAAIIISNPAKGLKIVSARTGASAPLAIPVDDYSTAIIISKTPGEYSYYLNYR